MTSSDNPSKEGSAVQAVFVEVDFGLSWEEAMKIGLIRGCQVWPGEETALHLRYWADRSAYDPSSGWPEPPSFPVVAVKRVD